MSPAPGTFARTLAIVGGLVLLTCLLLALLLPQDPAPASNGSSAKALVIAGAAIVAGLVGMLVARIDRQWHARRHRPE